MPSGGRSSPIPITLVNAPYEGLTVSIYINGYLPTYSSVYPSNLTFNQGDTVKEFWISVGKSSVGINGSLVILTSGANNDSYNMIDRKVNFLVISPNPIGPLMFQRGNLLYGETWISTYVVMNRPCTLYFGLFDVLTSQMDMGFSNIKAKKVPFDYYAEEYWMGEFIEDISNFNYSLTINGLTPYKDYYLQVYLEDLNGNINDSPILSNITTNRTFLNPLVALVNIVGATSMDTNTTNSMRSILSQSLGIPTSRFEIDQSLFPNMSVELSASNRYFPSRILANSTNTTSTTTTTTNSSSINTNTTTNSSNSTNVFSIPTANQNSMIVQILFLPELSNPSNLNMFQAFARLRLALIPMLQACIFNFLILFGFILILIIFLKVKNPSSVNINYTFGTSGIFSYYTKIYANQWSNQPRIAQIWTNSVDVENIGLKFPGFKF